MQSFEITHNTISEGKCVIQNPSESILKDLKKHTFEENEVYALDVYMTNGAGKVGRMIGCTWGRERGQTGVWRKETRVQAARSSADMRPTPPHPTGRTALRPNPARRAPPSTATLASHTS